MLNNRLVDYTAFRQICLAWKSVKTRAAYVRFIAAYDSS